MIQSVPFFIKRAASHPANVVSAPLHLKKIKNILIQTLSQLTYRTG